MKFKVRSDIFITINSCEFVALIGKSGSGKSTSLYILSTMDTAYEGTFSIENKTITGQNKDNPAVFRNEKMGFVFQFHYLLPKFSCLKNLMIPALKCGNLSRDKLEAKAYQKRTLFGLKDQELKLSSKLSGRPAATPCPGMCHD